MESLGVSISLTSGFHPETNGQVERVNQDVGTFLRSYCQDRPGEWAALVPWAEMAQNSLRHSSTNLSSFLGVPGYQLVLAPWQQGQTKVSAVDDWFRRAEETWEAVRDTPKEECRSPPQPSIVHMYIVLINSYLDLCVLGICCVIC